MVSQINFTFQKHRWCGNPWKLEIQGPQGPSPALGPCEKCYIQYISQSELGHDLGEVEQDSGQGALCNGCPHPETL